MNPQLNGTESLEGTYLFDLERSGRALRLNRFLHGLTDPAKRAMFRDDPAWTVEEFTIDLPWKRNYGTWAFIQRAGGTPPRQR